MQLSFSFVKFMFKSINFKNIILFTRIDLKKKTEILSGK